MACSFDVIQQNSVCYIGDLDPDVFRGRGLTAGHMQKVMADNRCQQALAAVPRRSYVPQKLKQ